MNKFLLIIMSAFLLVGVAYASEFSAKVPLPGESIANPKLQLDALPTVYIMASVFQSKNCYNMHVKDTAVTVKPYDVIVKRGVVKNAKWAEKWTVNACGQDVIIPINFYQTKGSTTFAVQGDGVELK